MPLVVSALVQSSLCVKRRLQILSKNSFTFDAVVKLARLKSRHNFEDLGGPLVNRLSAPRSALVESSPPVKWSVQKFFKKPFTFDAVVKRACL